MTATARVASANGSVGAAEIQQVESEVHGMRLFTAVSVACGLVVVLVSVFIPPLLCFNIPILIAFAAIQEVWVASHRGVVVKSLRCPECATTQSPLARAPELPIRLRCAACGVALLVEAHDSKA